MPRVRPLISSLVWIVVGLACLSRSSLARAADSLPIAVLNLDRIFDATNYKPLADRMAPLKVEAAEVEQKIQVRQVELETVQNQLRAARQGTPDFDRLQVQFSKLQTELQLFVNRERQAMQKKEGVIYLALYREVDDEVQKYCRAKGIKLVIRQQQTRTEGDVTPQELLKALNRIVIYEDGLDITDEILKALAVRAEAN